MPVRAVWGAVGGASDEVLERNGQHVFSLFGVYAGVFFVGNITRDEELPRGVEIRTVPAPIQDKDMVAIT